MGSVELRLQRLEARNPPTRTAEIGARACRRLSTEDLRALREGCRRLLDGGALTREERDAFGQVWGRYGAAWREVAHER